MVMRDFWKGVKDKGLFLYVGFFVLYLIFFSLVVFITAVNGSLNLWIEKIKIYIFMSPKTSDSQVLKLIDDIKSNFHVKEILYITQKDAWERLKELIGRENDIFTWGSPDSLPKALEITPMSLDNLDKLLGFVMEYGFVEDLRYSEDMVKQWYELKNLVDYIKKIFVYLGSLAFLIISVELLSHAHLAFSMFSVSSQVGENIFITFVSSFLSFISVYLVSNTFKNYISIFLPYFSYIFDIRHILIWFLYFILSNIIVSFTSALISFQRLK